MISGLFFALAGRVFDGGAARAKTTMGWFYGFKLHLTVSHEGELVAFALTAGNVDDRVPVPALIQQVFGKLFGDKGYLSQPLRDELRDISIEFDYLRPTQHETTVDAAVRQTHA